MDNLPEGLATIGSTATDVLEKPAVTSPTVTVKVDRTRPVLAQPSGELWDARDRADDKRFMGLYGSEYSLHVTASDVHSGIKNIEVYVDNVSQADRGGIATGPILDWTLRPDNYADGSHTIKIVTRDNVDGLSGAPDRHTDTTSFDVMIDRQGDVVSADASSGDPAVAASDLEVSETVQLLTDNVRIEDLHRTRTARRVPCDAQPAGCLELREQAPDDTDQPASVTAFVDETATGQQVRSESVLFGSIEAGASPKSTGTIAAAAEPWQVLPPGHGATFGRYESAEEMFVDGQATTVVLEVLADQQTKLPIRITRTAGTEKEAATYLTYAPQRVGADSLPADYFALGGSTVTASPMPAPPTATPATSAFDDDALVARASRVRERLGLRIDDSFIRQITLDLDLPTREDALDAIGIPLDAAELDEITTRFELQGRAAERLPDFASAHPDDYAGSYIDQQTGTLYVGFTADHAANLASIRAVIGLDERVEGFTATRTLQQLEQLRAVVRDDWVNGTLDAYEINGLSVDEQQNAVMIGVEHSTDGVRDALVARYGSGIVVEEQPKGQPAVNPNNVSVNEAIGGIAILRRAGSGSLRCTSGFGAKKRVTVNGRSRVAYYLLSAGHCAAAEGSQDRWTHLNGGDSPFTLGRTEKNAFYYADPSDALAIRLANPRLRSSRMFVRYRNNQARTDARVKGASDFAVKGSIVCYSGSTSSGPAGDRSICGQIQKFKQDLDVNGQIVDEGIEAYLDDDCRDRGGDSGAGIWMKRRKTDKGIWAVGLLSAQVPKVGDCGFGAFDDKTKRVLVQGIGPVLSKFDMSLNTQTGTQE